MPNADVYPIVLSATVPHYFQCRCWIAFGHRFQCLTCILARNADLLIRLEAEAARALDDALMNGFEQGMRAGVKGQ